MSEQILLVDDDRNVLDGYRRNLRGEFSVDTVESGQEALAQLESKGPYAVVISDMKMPGMDGIELLRRVKSAAPDTVRVMLTGHAETQTAIEAINEGSIFRFLIKPCDKEMMAKTITAALVQHRLITAEKQLLEQTLSGCLQVLSEVLSLVNPAAFSRAERARRYIHHVATAMKLGNPWQYEVAAILSQLGCVTLAPETIETVYQGRNLSPAEQAQYGRTRADFDVVAVGPQTEHAELRGPLSEVQRKHQITVASGMGTMNRAPQVRACASCDMISSLRFHGRMKMKSGFSLSRCSGGWMGMCVPGKNRPCLYGLRSTVKSMKSVRIPQ